MLSLSLSPSYPYLHDCFKLNLVSLSKNKTTNMTIEQKMKYYFLYGSKNDAIIFTIPHHTLADLGCKKLKSNNSHVFNCSFRFDYKYKKATHMSYLFNLISKTSSMTNNTINFATGSRTHKLNCANN